MHQSLKIDRVRNEPDLLIATVQVNEADIEHSIEYSSSSVATEDRGSYEAPIITGR